MISSTSSTCAYSGSERFKSISKEGFERLLEGGREGTYERVTCMSMYGPYMCVCVLVCMSTPGHTCTGTGGTCVPHVPVCVCPCDLSETKSKPSPVPKRGEVGRGFSFRTWSTRMQNHRTAEAGCPVRGTNQGRWAGEAKWSGEEDAYHIPPGSKPGTGTRTYSSIALPYQDSTYERRAALVPHKQGGV